MLLIKGMCLMNRIICSIAILTLLLYSVSHAKQVEGGFYGIPWGATKEQAEQIVGSVFVHKNGYKNEAYETEVTLFDKLFKATLQFDETGFCQASIWKMDYKKMEDAAGESDLFSSAFIKKYGKPTEIKEITLAKTYFKVECEWFLPHSQIMVNSFGVKGAKKKTDSGVVMIFWKSRKGKDLDKI